MLTQATKRLSFQIVTPLLIEEGLGQESQENLAAVNGQIALINHLVGTDATILAALHSRDSEPDSTKLLQHKHKTFIEYQHFNFAAIMQDPATWASVRQNLWLRYASDSIKAYHKAGIQYEMAKGEQKAAWLQEKQRLAGICIARMECMKKFVQQEQAKGGVTDEIAKEATQQYIAIIQQIRDENIIITREFKNGFRKQIQTLPELSEAEKVRQAESKRKITEGVTYLDKLQADWQTHGQYAHLTCEELVRVSDLLTSTLASIQPFIAATCSATKQRYLDLKAELEQQQQAIAAAMLKRLQLREYAGHESLLHALQASLDKECYRDDSLMPQGTTAPLLMTDSASNPPSAITQPLVSSQWKWFKRLPLHRYALGLYEDDPARLAEIKVITPNEDGIYPAVLAHNNTAGHHEILADYCKRFINTHGNLKTKEELSQIQHKQATAQAVNLNDLGLSFSPVTIRPREHTNDTTLQLIVPDTLRLPTQRNHRFSPLDGDSKQIAFFAEPAYQEGFLPTLFSLKTAVSCTEPQTMALLLAQLHNDIEMLLTNRHLITAEIARAKKAKSGWDFLNLTDKNKTLMKYMSELNTLQVTLTTESNELAKKIVAMVKYKLEDQRQPLLQPEIMLYERFIKQYGDDALLQQYHCYVATSHALEDLQQGTQDDLDGSLALLIETLRQAESVADKTEISQSTTTLTRLFATECHRQLKWLWAEKNNGTLTSEVFETKVNELNRKIQLISDKFPCDLINDLLEITSQEQADCFDAYTELNDSLDAVIASHEGEETGSYARLETLCLDRTRMKAVALLLNEEQKKELAEKLERTEALMVDYSDIKEELAAMRIVLTKGLYNGMLQVNSEIKKELERLPETPLKKIDLLQKKHLDAIQELCRDIPVWKSKPKQFDALCDQVHRHLDLLAQMKNKYQNNRQIVADMKAANYEQEILQALCDGLQAQWNGVLKASSVFGYYEGYQKLLTILRQLAKLKERYEIGAKTPESVEKEGSQLSQLGNIGFSELLKKLEKSLRQHSIRLTLRVWSRVVLQNPINWLYIKVFGLDDQAITEERPAESLAILPTHETVRLPELFGIAFGAQTELVTKRVSLFKNLKTALDVYQNQQRGIGDGVSVENEVTLCGDKYWYTLTKEQLIELEDSLKVLIRSKAIDSDQMPMMVKKIIAWGALKELEVAAYNFNAAYPAYPKERLNDKLLWILKWQNKDPAFANYLNIVLEHIAMFVLNTESPKQKNLSLPMLGNHDQAVFCRDALNALQRLLSEPKYKNIYQPSELVIQAMNKLAIEERPQMPKTDLFKQTRTQQEQEISPQEPILESTLSTPSY